MILVVFAHVETFMLSIDPGTTFLSSMFLSFRMPLFFFISGYLVYKAGLFWTFDVWKQRVCKKLRIQLFPTLFWGSIYTYLFSLGNFQDFISNYHKFGYWFTICLLGMLLIVYTTNWIGNILAKGESDNFVSWMLIVITSLLFLFKFLYDKYSILSTISDYICFHQVCTYFPFFTFGYIASQHKTHFESFLDNGIIQFFIYLLFCVTFYLKITLTEAEYESSYVLLVYRSIQDIVIGVLGICIVYNFFRRNSAMFSKDKVIGRQLQHIGSRTLDIYMLHYFFLTKVPFHTNIFEGGNLVCELFCVGILSIFITYCSLLVSDILRMSKIASYYLFGTTKS